MYSTILHGRRRLAQLQKWPNFRVSVNLFQNASHFSNSFSSVATAADVSLRDGRKGNNFTVSYLVSSLGFTSKLAESISRKVSFEDKVNPDSVLNLLRSYGFTESQISSIITDYPLLLIADAEKSISRKLQFLHSRGASSSEVTEIVSTVPKILGKQEGKSISRYYDFVKEIIDADKSFKLGKLCHSLAEGSKQENKIRNLLVLRDLGMPQKRLFPLLISFGAPIHGKEKFDEALNKVVEMGFDPTSANFVLALRIVYGLSKKTIEEKMQVYERLGLAVGDVWEIFKKNPMFLGYSEKKIRNYIEVLQGLGISRDESVMMIKQFPPSIGLSAETLEKKTEFLVKKIKWPLKAVVSCPGVLGASMEKKIVPRCNVIKALMSKGLLGGKGSKLPPISLLKISDQVFLNRYVLKHDKLVPELMAIYNEGRVS